MLSATCTRRIYSPRPPVRDAQGSARVMQPLAKGESLQRCDALPFEGRLIQRVHAGNGVTRRSDARDVL